LSGGSLFAQQQQQQQLQAEDGLVMCASGQPSAKCTSSTAVKTFLNLMSEASPAPQVPVPAPLVVVDRVPQGWVRKVVRTKKSPYSHVLYYNLAGKKFSCQREVTQYFRRLGFVIQDGCFDFSPPTPSTSPTPSEEAQRNAFEQSTPYDFTRFHLLDACA
jgi:hypothetical protein